MGIICPLCGCELPYGYDWCPNCGWDAIFGTKDGPFADYPMEWEGYKMFDEFDEEFQDEFDEFYEEEDYFEEENPEFEVASAKSAYAFSFRFEDWIVHITIQKIGDDE